MKDKEERTRKKPGRVPTSCAECRRLKLRCDKAVPCGKCVTRGCGSICPDGQLTSGKGNRLVLANTEELHERIENLCNRVRDLEDALRTLHESVSTDPHPLLRSDLLQIKSRPAPPQRDGVDSASPGSSSSSSTLVSDGSSHYTRTEEENFIDAFGTLTIGPHGEANFLGQTARSEYLFHALAKISPPLAIPPARLPRRITELSFLDPEVVDEDIGREIFGLLPPLSEAIRLCDTYLEHPYLSIMMERTELIDDVLEGVYRSGSFETMRTRHSLALLFAVFATAVLLDQRRAPYSAEAQEYFYLARAALALASPVRETTLEAIHALLHMAQYLDLSDWEGRSGSSTTWLYVGTAVRLAYGVGLHLNSNRWHLCGEAGERRNRLFWQVFIQDTWSSFALGRPVAMSMSYIDCPHPKDPPEVIAEDNGQGQSFASFLSRFSVLMHSVMSTAFGAKVPSYATVLDLDRKIRDFYVPRQLRPGCGIVEIPPPSADVLMRRFTLLQMKESALLNLHRAYFAQALQDSPDDLASHRFLPSVMAAYRSAWRLIRMLIITWGAIPSHIARVTGAWSPPLSAAIVMCILVTRAPTSKMTKSSLDELDSIAHLFEEAASSSRIAAALVAPIQVLARRAHQAVDSHPPYPEHGCVVTPADLDRLGGKTHLVSNLGCDVNDKHTSRRSQPASAGAHSPSDERSLMMSDAEVAAAAAAGSGGTGSDMPMHPTIAQDMRSFDLGEPSLFYGAFPNGAGAAEMSGVQFTGTGDARTGVFGVHGPGQMPGYGLLGSLQAPGAGGFGAGTSTPILDATWQSFVEQLGF